jgi:PAS domain S-box-containing protein
MNSEEDKTPSPAHDSTESCQEVCSGPRSEKDTIERLLRENAELNRKYSTATQYIRNKVNQLLTVMGTSTLKPEELDDKTLIETDPIGIISDSFVQILKHLHKTNAKLKITNQEIKAIFDSAGAGILVIDGEMRTLAYNAKLREQFFSDKLDVTGQSCYRLICNLSNPYSSCPFTKVFDSGETIHLTGWVLNNRYFDIVCTPVKDEHGEVTRAVLLYMDITDRMHTEQALRQSEEKYRDLFENANDLIQSIGPDGAFLYVNRAWRERLGYGEDEVPGLSAFDILHPDCSECGPDFKSVVFGETSGRIETVFITKSGRKINVEGNISTAFSEGKLIGTRGIFRDITERKEAEEILSSERERLAVTLRCIGDGVITTDIEGKVVLMNKVSEDLTGWSQEQAKGRPITEVLHLINETSRTVQDNPVEILLKSGKAVDILDHTLLVASDGKERLISDSVSPIVDRKSNIIGTVLVFRDITEKRNLEEKLLKTEKIESLGVLAGGIAHDFNNLLNAIMGNIDLAVMDLEPGDRIHESLSRAEKAVLRAKDLTQQLLTFSKGGAPIKKAASISELIRDSADFAIRGSNAKCGFDLPEDLWKVEIDLGQMSQVINNIVLNGTHAMPGGGQIYIRAENIVIGYDSPELRKGKYVKVSIKDAGSGIPKEHLPRIFEPYFTTKHTGSGLGLATTYSIIKKHDGHIEVASHIGKGTIFSIFLPALSENTALNPFPDEKPSKKGRGRVLLMDDDDMVRATTSEMLKRIGYEVVGSAEGNETFEIYKTARNTGEPFDAVILDLTIPGGMGGKETIIKLLEFDPGVKAIVSSGYSSDSIMANYLQYGFSGVLTKPYQTKDLSSVLQKAISDK